MMKPGFLPVEGIYDDPGMKHTDHLVPVLDWLANPRARLEAVEYDFEDALIHFHLEFRELEGLGGVAVRRILEVRNLCQEM